MEKPEEKLGLALHLANRLYPVTLAIGFLISFGAPVTYFVIESSALRRTATLQAQELSRKLEYFVLDSPILWKYQAHKYIQVLANDLVLQSEVTTIRVLDETEKSITGYEYATEKAQLWWNYYAPVGSAHIVFNNGHFLYVNYAWRETLGYNKEEVSRLSILDTIHPDSHAHCLGIFGRVISGEKVDKIEALFLTKEGKTIAVEGSSNCKFVDGKPVSTRGIFRNITERKQAEEQLWHNAFHDVLTDLPNRALFMEQLDRAIEKAKRHQDYLFAVLFLDLDRFKIINDSLGHLVGDQLLVAIARRLEACLRPGDTVARLGGDEFTILLDNIKDHFQVIDVAERIQASLAMPFNLNGHEVFTTASIGITLSMIGYNQPEDLLRDADAAMYSAKSLGKARYEVFDTTMHARAVELLHLETDLRRAIERQEFQLYYQPVVHLKTGRIVGFEALIRWQQPLRGLLSPEDFIPTAEETGLIVPIGEWILREACSQMQAWQRQFPAATRELNPQDGALPLSISVNVSSQQFSQDNLIAQINQTLRETGLDVHSLKLEKSRKLLNGKC